eukprot:7380013-Prymnesium_polylepis.1
MHVQRPRTIFTGRITRAASAALAANEQALKTSRDNRSPCPTPHCCAPAERPRAHAPCSRRSGSSRTKDPSTATPSASPGCAAATITPRSWSNSSCAD